MARIDDLVQQVGDPELREKLASAVEEIRSRQQLGLVFEEHVPELGALPGLAIEVDGLAQFWEGGEPQAVRVLRLSGEVALVERLPDGSPEEVAVERLVAIRRFGEPIYPALTHMGTAGDGTDNKPHHSVVNGENYHVLQMLLYLYEGQVDCIYIDPPYNTGARDWKYNNDYVDENDGWRHSKWLSMMEKRLLLAKRLLSRDGVLVVTIDENELLHLGMLLESVFKGALRQLVSICINPGGASGDGFSRVEEYAFFVFLGDARPVETEDDMLSNDEGVEKPIRWEWLMRGGSSWYRSSRPNLCYPILLDDEGERIVGVGAPLEGEDEESRPARVDGKLAAWPVRSDGKLGIWRVDGAKLETLASQGYAYVSREDTGRGTWTIKYLLSGSVKEIENGLIEVTGRTDRGQAIVQRTGSVMKLAKTVWNRPRHNAGGVGGTHLLTAQLGERGLFSYPKSVYSTLDCLQVAVGDRPDAVILDFFGGSGTTLNAALLMNDGDGGSRRAIVVTNNEVSAEARTRLLRGGALPGDVAFEAEGIFERVTRPRCTAAVTGQRSDGEPAKGKYLNGKPYEEGFDAVVDFFRLDYLDPDAVELGAQFDRIHPALWATAGSIGPCPTQVPAGHDFFASSSNYAVLFNESNFRGFLSEVTRRGESLTHVWIVTNSEQAFSEMRELLPRPLHVSMLYRDYLRNFEINTAERMR